MAEAVDLFSLTPRPLAAAAPKASAAPATGSDLADSFQKVLAEKMDALSGLQAESARLDRALAAGEAVDISQVMVAAAKANLALDMAVQVRNLALRAYTQVTQIR